MLEGQETYGAPQEGGSLGGVSVAGDEENPHPP